MKTFKFKLINLDGTIEEYDLESLTCQTPLGEISILANHQPLITIVNKGKIKLKTENSIKEIELITDSLLEVNYDEVKLICFAF